LPDEYVRALAALIMADANTSIPQSSPIEQNTEPLPVVVDTQFTSRQTSNIEPAQPVLPVQPAQATSLPQSRTAGLVVFACFSSMLLLAALALAVLQSLGSVGNVFTGGFAPLNVPWYVLLYGLIGGSMSCLVTLGRQYKQVAGDLPGFILIVWCSRPFIGVVLAMLSYLFLNTGLFMSPGSAVQHVMLSSLLAVLTGFCEGWLFKKWIV
ncbi:MAG TPA: hypothetical protein VKR42_03520, partial [Ktedonobacteraceae bacterium]|nr:hypothetical protein [Ktedonobacteraceae bacterium]